jgi:hypothetical protein
VGILIEVLFLFLLLFECRASKYHIARDLGHPAASITLFQLELKAVFFCSSKQDLNSLSLGNIKDRRYTARQVNYWPIPS